MNRLVRTGQFPYIWNYKEIGPCFDYSGRQWITQKKFVCIIAQIIFKLFALEGQFLKFHHV